MSGDGRTARINLANLSARDLRQLERSHRKWQRLMAPHYRAIQESQRITAKDLAVRIGPCQERAR